MYKALLSQIQQWDNEGGVLMVAWHIMFHKNTEKIIYDCVAYMCVCGGKYDLINPCENLINYLHLKVYPELNEWGLNA